MIPYWSSWILMKLVQNDPQVVYLVLITFDGGLTPRGHTQKSLSVIKHEVYVKHIHTVNLLLIAPQIHDIYSMDYMNKNRKF